LSSPLSFDFLTQINIVASDADHATFFSRQSTYIPLGQIHRFSIPGPIPPEIIEVQSRSYLGEDDIVRFEETYGRSSQNNEFFNGFIKEKGV
jgi:Mannose-6-phosphate isomerase